jgi:meiotic recombination protein SPO11
MHSCPIHALVDFDPDGIDIMSTYKHGSIALAHENENLSVNHIHWLGLSNKDLVKDDGVHRTQGLLKLTSRDRRKAIRMLEREPFMEGGKEPDWRREIQIMLMLNVKAEIQLLEAGEGGLHGWITDRLS